MKHTSRNLFLIILMGYSLTALPLNPELATLDLSRFSYENVIRNQAIQGQITYAYVLNSAQKTLVNPETVEFILRAEGGKKPKWTEAPPLRLDILQSDGTPVKSLEAGSFYTVVQENPFNPYEIRYTLNLSRKALGLSGGSYAFKVASQDAALSAVPPLSVPAQYLDQVAYVPAASGPGAGKQMLISYYPDTSGKYAVPVSREIPNSGKLFRAAVNQLLTPPPASMGLRATVSVPRVSSIQYTNGLVSCILSAPVPPELYTDAGMAAVAEKTLTASIAAIQSPYRISRVRYTWSGAPPVPGWPTDEITIPASSKAWLGLSTTGNRVLLVPAPVAQTGADSLVNLLKTGTDGLMATLPGQARLKEARLEGDVMVLIFEDGFSGLFEGSPDLARLAVDSLVHTMTSLPGVTAVRLQEDARIVQSLADVPVPNPLYAAPYVNPESGFQP